MAFILISLTVLYINSLSVATTINSRRIPFIFEIQTLCLSDSLKPLYFKRTFVGVQSQNVLVNVILCRTECSGESAVVTTQLSPSEILSFYFRCFGRDSHEFLLRSRSPPKPRLFAVTLIVVITTCSNSLGTTAKLITFSQLTYTDACLQSSQLRCSNVYDELPFHVAIKQLRQQQKYINLQHCIPYNQ